jgi:hypothetical protein
MTRTMRVRVGLGVAAVAIGLGASLQAQFRGAPEWTTSGYDAQRTGWVRSDGRLTKSAVEKGTFAFLWKAKFDNEAHQLTSLTEPILQDLLIGYRGFKTLAFVGGSADKIFAIDTDLARPYWTASLNYTASTGGRPPETIDCPGGLMATPSRRTAVAPSTFGAGGGGGFGRGGSMKSAVGKPGEGAMIIAERRGQPQAPPPQIAPPPPARTGDAPVSFGGVDTLWVMASDGFLRALRVSDGAETRVPIAFVPPSARPSSLIYLEGMVYTSTSHGCGAAPNAVWAVDVLAPEADRKVLSWKTGGASIIGTAGPAFGTDGTLYVALGDGPAIGTDTSAATDGQGAESAYSNAIVSLDRETLRPKDWFSIEGAHFSTSPTVVRYKDKDVIAVGASDGRVFLLDGASLGGSDHKTPLFASAKSSGGGIGTGTALATWEDDAKTRWLLAPAEKNIVAFKMTDQGGKVALEDGWKSRDLVSPLAPIVVNGLVMAASSGEYRGTEASLSAAARAQKSTPAVFYVLDGATGKELFTSGNTITSFARGGLSAGGGQVYLVTYDNHLYAFGIPMEH